MPTAARSTDTPAREFRYDRGELLSPVTRADGTMLVEGFAAREGILEYRRGDGTVRRELVTAQTLEESAHGLARVPVTLEHPDPRVHRDGVTPDNVGALGVGDVDGEVTVHEDGFVRVKMAVRRRDAVDALRTARARELSAGYDVVLDPTPGTHPTYGRYDAVQVERTYNHLAIVPRARAGREVRARVDSATSTTTIGAASPAVGPTNSRGGAVNSRLIPLLTLLGITSRIDSDDEAIDAAVDALKKRGDGDAGTTAKETARADAAEALVVTEKARADKAEAALAELAKATQARDDASELERLTGLASRMGMHVNTGVALPLLRRTIAAAHLGRDLRADATDEHIAGIIEAASAKHEDGAEHHDGREAGRQAWQGAPPAESKAKGKAKPSRYDGRSKRRGGE